MNSQKELTANDIMTKDVIVVSPNTPLLEAAEKMTKNFFNGLPVVDESNTVVGIITEYDLLTREGAIHLPTFIRLFARYPQERPENLLVQGNLREVLNFTVKDMMNPEPLLLRAETSIEEVMQTFAQHHKVNPIPIVSPDRKLVGIVSRYDIIKFYAKMSSGERKS